jgi:transaldolase
MVDLKSIQNLNIKIFSDGADKEEMIRMSAQSFIHGLTTNPTLMRKAGISDYRLFCKEILEHIKDKPLSFEVFSDDHCDMERQALEIASWGPNVYVKIPVTNTKKETSYALIQKLVAQKVKVNITAVMTLEQVQHIAQSLNPHIPSYVSIFAGRIADTGRDPIPLMLQALEILKSVPKSELIWASPRELLNIFQAAQIGCPIITVTQDILKKLSLLFYDLEAYSLETVKMFYNDAQAAGFRL